MFINTAHPLRVALLLLLFGWSRVWALAPESIQGDTLTELIATLEARHYEGRDYNDSLSSEHLDAYIDALDPQKMFFTREDVAAFLAWRTELDDLGREGDLGPAFTIFNRFQANLEARLTDVIKGLPESVSGS